MLVFLELMRSRKRHVDTKILETLVELKAGEPLPLGLRVDAFVVTN